MKLENQVCSLELSKKLKELGFKQKSTFYYADNEDGQWVLCFSFDGEQDPIISIIGEISEDEDGGFIPAYTVAELGEMLPPFSSEQECVDWDCNKLANGWEYVITRNYFAGEWTSDQLLFGVENNEADARAKMLIYLKENSLI